MEEKGIGEIFHDRVHNQKWFTARGVQSISKATGQEADFIARVICIFVLILLITESNWIVCNSILVGIPLAVTYCYPQERPPPENMRVYWITAFIVTSFDRMLEVFPLYYVVKMCFFLFLLVEPSCLNDKLKRLLKISDKAKRDSPPSQPEPPPKQPEQPVSAWGRFTETLKSAIGAAAPQQQAAPVQPQKKTDSPRRKSSESTAVTGKSIGSEPRKSSEESGAPTPYDTQPFKKNSAETTTSYYFNIPKPVDKPTSIRLAPSQKSSRKHGPGSPSSSERKKQLKKSSTGTDSPSQSKSKRLRELMKQQKMRK